MNKEAIDLTTEAELDAAMERAKTVPDRPLAISAEYDTKLDVVVLRLNNGRRLVLPRESLQELHTATPEQLAEIEIYSGVDIAWPRLDVDLYLPHLLEGRYGSEEWMKSLHKSMVAA